MLKCGNKIKMVKQIGQCDLIGETLIVTNVDAKEELLSFELPPTEEEIKGDNPLCGVGTMDFDTYKKHFVWVRDWTPWTEQEYNHFTRTDNEKYVQLKANGIRVEASCHPSDTFDFHVGVAVYQEKLNRKLNKIQVKEV